MPNHSTRRRSRRGNQDWEGVPTYTWVRVCVRRSTFVSSNCVVPLYSLRFGVLPFLLLPSFLCPNRIESDRLLTFLPPTTDQSLIRMHVQTGDVHTITNRKKSGVDKNEKKLRPNLASLKSGAINHTLWKTTHDRNNENRFDGTHTHKHTDTMRSVGRMSFFLSFFSPPVSITHSFTLGRSCASLVCTCAGIHLINPRPIPIIVCMAYGLMRVYDALSPCVCVCLTRVPCLLSSSCVSV